MEKLNLESLKEVNNNVKEKIGSKISRIMDIKTFEDGVRKGLYTDSKGTAYLIINGVLNATYNVYIDRLRITKAGSVVSFLGLLKTYSPDEIQIRYDLKETRLPHRHPTNTP
ncbi:MAG: hypothetical protein IKW81_03130 [Pseudobutyrivibrio sp.]|nr:hypothetical protein [Pseudobutyrivibrio sp.]